MRPRPILVLGGTGLARAAAGALVENGHDVITSLAGVTQDPVLPPGRLRIGGFGGIDGLMAFLSADNVALVVDATHPFAARMSAQAAEACERMSLPILRCEPAAWKPVPGDRWINVQTVAEAAAALPAGARVLLTIGRKEVEPFFARGDLSGLARMIEEPPVSVPPQWQVLRARPPFGEASEAALMAENVISHLVSKNAGGDSTAAKLQAARRGGIAVVMVARPAKPEVPCFASPEALRAAVAEVLSP